jgi:hypothetical protein
MKKKEITYWYNLELLFRFKLIYIKLFDNITLQLIQVFPSDKNSTAVRSGIWKAGGTRINSIEATGFAK